MATYGSLQHIFDNQIPDNSSSLIESLSSSCKKNTSPTPSHHSFTELFGELHFKDNPNSLSSSSSFLINEYPGSYHRKSKSFSSMNSESLQMCTEGLGFESLDNIDKLKIESDIDDNNESNDIDSHYNYDFTEKLCSRNYSDYQYRKKTDKREFPPPISCIGRPGKARLYFKSCKEDGRFVLKEIRIPSQEIMHAYREDGRLRLNFVQQDDEVSIRGDNAEEEDEGGEKLGAMERIDEDEEEEAREDSLD